MRAWLRSLGFVMTMASVACSTSSGGPAEAEPAAAAPAPTTATTTADPPADPAPPARPYPAFRPSPPTLALGAGKVLASPRIQVISYADDPSAPVVDAFVSSLGTSDYWSAVTREYGIGAATKLETVSLTDTAPSAIDDAQIAADLASRVAAGSVAQPDGETVYVYVFPAGTTVTTHGVTTCTSIGGYHAEATLGQGSAPYVVVPRCGSFNGYVGDDLLTYTLSHELVEAATNPFRTSAPGFVVDDAHAAWIAIFGEEAGDLCEEQTMRLASGALVQRIWSNAAASAGHQPCAPSAGKPYFNAAPVLPDTTTIAGSDVPAVKVRVGTTRTIDLQLFSDAPAPAWKVEVFDGASAKFGKPAQLALSLDRKTGANGDVLRLTIEALTRGKTGRADGVSTFVVRSSGSGQETYWAALVSND